MKPAVLGAIGEDDTDWGNALPVPEHGEAVFGLGLLDVAHDRACAFVAFPGPFAPLGGQDGKGRSGSKGPKGAATCVLRANGLGLLFHLPRALSATTISKMPVKPPRPSPTDSTGVAIPPKTLTEYDAVAPGLVLRGLVSGSDGCFERALAPGCAEYYGEACGPLRTRHLTRSYWAVGSSVDRHDG